MRRTGFGTARAVLLIMVRCRWLALGLLLVAGCGDELAPLEVEVANMEGTCVDPCPGGERYGSRTLELRLTAGDEPWEGEVRWLRHIDSSDVLGEPQFLRLSPGETRRISFTDDGCPSGPDGTREVLVPISLDGDVLEVEGEYSVGMSYDC